MNLFDTAATGRAPKRHPPHTFYAYRPARHIGWKTNHDSFNEIALFMINTANEDEELWVRMNPKQILDLWQKENPGGWASRLPNPFDETDHTKRLAGLSLAEKAEFASAWNSALDRLSEKLWSDYVVQDVIDEIFGS